MYNRIKIKRIMMHDHKIWSILTDSLFQGFGRIKLHKKRCRNKKTILKKVIAIFRLIFYNCISNRHFLCQKLLCTNTVLENWPQNRDSFLKKKNIYFYAILCDKKFRISCLLILIMFNVKAYSIPKNTT